MQGIDTSFSIETLDAFHLRVGERSYWEGLLGAGAGQGGRFVFRPGWRTVYASAVEAAFLRIRLADGTTGWGEPNAQVGPEIVCRIAQRLLLPILVRRCFEDPAALWDFLYDTQRGRGHFSGFYLDAIAGLDVLWSFGEVEQAAAAKLAYGGLGAEWLECPLLPEDLAGHRALQGRPGLGGRGRSRGAGAVRGALISCRA